MAWTAPAGCIAILYIDPREGLLEEQSGLVAKAQPCSRRIVELLEGDCHSRCRGAHSLRLGREQGGQ